MHPLDNALVFLNNQEAPNVSQAAREFQVQRSTLGKKFQRQSGSRAQAAEKKQFLSIKQEKTLIKDINRLCERGLPPCMVANIAGQITKKQPGKDWTSRFVKRWTESWIQDISTHWTFQGTRLNLSIHSRSISIL